MTNAWALSSIVLLAACSQDKRAPSPQISTPAVPGDATAVDAASPTDVATRLLASLRAERDRLTEARATPAVDIDWHIARIEAALDAARAGSAVSLQSAVDLAERYARANASSERSATKGDARTSWEASCEQGDAPACWRLATDIGSSNKPRYRELATRSCELGFSSGCVSAGYQFDYERDDGTYSRLLLKGCDMGDPAGCGHLAAGLLNGIGVAKNLPRALELFTRACEMGQGMSCATAGTMHTDGRGTGKDAARGRTYFERACKLHDAYGCTLARQHATPK